MGWGTPGNIGEEQADEREDLPLVAAAAATVPCSLLLPKYPKVADDRLWKEEPVYHHQCPWMSAAHQAAAPCSTG